MSAEEEKKRRAKEEAEETEQKKDGELEKKLKKEGERRSGTRTRKESYVSVFQQVDLNSWQGLMEFHQETLGKVQHGEYLEGKFSLRQVKFFLGY